MIKIRQSRDRLIFNMGIPIYWDGPQKVVSINRYFHYKDKMVVIPSYLYNENPILARWYLYMEHPHTFLRHRSIFSWFTCTSKHLKSPATQLFIQQCVQINNKEKNTSSLFCHLCPLTKGLAKLPYAMTFSCTFLFWNTFISFMASISSSSLYNLVSPKQTNLFCLQGSHGDCCLKLNSLKSRFSWLDIVWFTPTTLRDPRFD